MDFKVTANNQTQTFEQYRDALNYVDQIMAQWNNFAAHQPLNITVEKVQSHTETHNLQVDEQFKVGDIFGG